MGNYMFNDEQLADAEVRAQASGIILSREAFLLRLHVLADTVAHNDSLLPSEVDLSAHDAALRSALAAAERERDALLRERGEEWTFQFVEEMKAKCNSCTLVESLERERDEARACLSAERAIVASLCTHAGELESERDSLRSRLAALSHLGTGAGRRAG